MDFVFKPIGLIHTPFKEKDDAPIQAARSNTGGTIEVFSDYRAGLEGLEGFSHLILLYVFDRSPKEYALKVKPFLDNQLHGLFTTRYPCRPNPIGLSVVQLLSRNDLVLEVTGMDMLDGTPLLDIKPYVPEFDIHEVSKTGWYERRAYP
jgi:tRNA (adenine37-N6)-methyltransferase